MEAALRTVADVLTGENLQTVDYNDVRGMEQTREAELTIAGNTVKIAVVHTLASARKILERIRAGEADYQFIEVMACLVAVFAAAVNRFPLMQKLEEPVEKGCLIVIVPMSYENHMKIRKLKSFMILG